MSRPVFVLDASNLSIHARKFVRTGIQEVVYRTLLGAAAIRSELPELEILILPQLPRKLVGTSIVPYGDLPGDLLETVERESGMSSRELWGFDLRAAGYRLDQDALLALLARADHLHVQGLVNVGPLAERLARLKGGGRPSISMTVYDLVPVLYPEYCDDGIARWYASDYLPSLGRHVDHALCISRHTALDLLAHPLTASLPAVSVLPLPYELAPAAPAAPGLLARLGLAEREYLVSVGSLEPRKNFGAVLAGFEAYRELNPSSRLKLLLVGSTGWKNEDVERRLRGSRFAADIVRAGYLDDGELREAIRSALALVMLSIYEGYGLPVAQAFSLGVPAITTLGSSLPEACRGRAAFVDPMDPISVCAGIELVRRGEVPLGEPAREFAGWTWRGYARELLRSARPGPRRSASAPGPRP